MFTSDFYTGAGVAYREQQVASHLKEAQRRRTLKQLPRQRRRHGPGLGRLAGHAATGH